MLALKANFVEANSSSSKSDESEKVDECLTDLSRLPPSNLRQVLSNMLDEDLVVGSSLGPRVCAIVNKCLGSQQIDSLKNSVISQEIQKCFNLGTSTTIPLSRVLRKFHQVSLATFQLPSDVLVASDLALQCS